MATQPTIKPVIIRGKEYIDVASRVRLCNADEGYTMLGQERYECNGRFFLSITIEVKGKQYIGDSEIKFDAPRNTPDGSSPMECAQTSALGRALGFAGYGSVESIASADEVLRAIAAQTEPPQPPERPQPPRNSGPSNRSPKRLDAMPEPPQREAEPVESAPPAPPAKPLSIVKPEPPKKQRDTQPLDGNVPQKPQDEPQSPQGDEADSAEVDAVKSRLNAIYLLGKTKGAFRNQSTMAQYVGKLLKTTLSTEQLLCLSTAELSTLEQALNAESKGKEAQAS